jgi:capsular polysaccharide transport system ATP-binding protein
MIRLEGLTKSYLTLRGRKFVFRDVWLDIPGGVNVGLIGRNGAGKSTLMRLLSAVDMPDSGRIRTEGRLSWPVGLAGGMQGNLTGRDNVKFVCRIHGIRGSAMAEKVAYVEDFAQIGSYFDQPISTYSSGMRARVAFGTSMAFEFDYYLIDEIMAVGDVGFKAKSRRVFAERLKTGKVIIVTHNMGLIRKMCDAVVYLDAGKATFFPNLEDGIAAYEGLDAARAGDSAPGVDLATADDEALA